MTTEELVKKVYPNACIDAFTWATEMVVPDMNSSYALGETWADALSRIPDELLVLSVNSSAQCAFHPSTDYGREYWIYSTQSNDTLSDTCKSEPAAWHSAASKIREGVV